MRTETHYAGTEAHNDDDSTAIDLSKIRDKLTELERLCKRKIDAADHFSEACTIVASKAGIRPDVLRQYVTARVNDKVDEYEKKAEQLGLLFEEMGE